MPVSQHHVRNNWELIREDFIRRRIEGEKITYKDIAGIHGVGVENLKKRAQREKWGELLEKRLSKLASKEWAKLEIDWVKARKRLLGPGYRASKILTEELEALENRREAARNRGETLSISDIKRLAEIARSCIVDGAGLPKEHVFHGDMPDEIMANRDSMRKIEGMAKELAEFKRYKRQGKNPVEEMERAKDDDDEPSVH